MSGGSRQLARSRAAGEAMAAAELAVRSVAAQFAPQGQRVMPWEPAQLGLDGLAYAVSEGPRGTGAEPPSSEASHSLGTQHGLCRTGEDYRAFYEQLELELNPRRTRYQRQAQLAKLFPRESRLAKCMRCPVTGSDVGFERTESGAIRWLGLCQCGSAWGCPTHGFQRAREVTSVLSAAIQKHLRAGLFTDVWMLTLSPWHERGGSQREQIQRLWKAKKAFLDDRNVQRIFERFDIVAKVFAFDESFKFGWLHGHFHVALFPRSANIGGQPYKGMSDKERADWLDVTAAELLPFWERACRKVGALPDDKVDAFRKHGLRLDGGEKAAGYFAKWGLADEVGMGPVKVHNRFSLLDQYRAGDQKAGELFREFVEATKGKQIVSGLKDMCKALELSDDDIKEHQAKLKEQRDKEAAERGEEPQQPLRPFRVVIRSKLYKLALSLGWYKVIRVAELADEEGVDPQQAVDAALVAYGNARGERALPD